MGWRGVTGHLARAHPHAHALASARTRARNTPAHTRARARKQKIARGTSQVESGWRPDAWERSTGCAEGRTPSQQPTQSQASTSVCRTRGDFVCPLPPRAGLPTPRDACANLRWAGRGKQAASTSLTFARARAHTHAHTHDHARAHARTRPHARTRINIRATWAEFAAR